MTDGWKIALGVLLCGIALFCVFQFMVGGAILGLLYDIVGMPFGISRAESPG